MNAGRKQRYDEKIEFASERLSNVREWHSEKNDLKSRLATYKAFQEFSEAIVDISAMICKDEKKIVKDDYSNIEAIKALKIVDAKLADSLKEVNGLRNRVVHEYNGLSFEIFSDSIERLLKDCEEFLEVVEAWVGKKLKR